MVYDTPQAAKAFLKEGSAICMGNYDGFHFGHQAILENLLKNAKAKGLKSVLLTFYPHPVKVLAPDVAPNLIYTKEQKIEILSRTGLDCVIFHPFDRDFAKTKPEDFFTKTIIKMLKAKYITVGYDFTFGKKRTGTTETLESLAHENEVGIKIIKAKLQDNMLVSSSIIRKTVREANIPLSSKLLTRTFFLDGSIIQGHQRGTSLGIHTANLDTKNELIPPDGVYATTIRLGKKTYPSVTNIGFNPTFENKERSIETHILDFDETIYEKTVRLYFIHKLRDEIKFATPTALVKQINKDIEAAKEYHKKHKIKE
ncbi:riboflavin biosynthesis protein RibF [bacterium K02(2017)]|nr:riboflavin biosynthesis protein RibF [bacterium K02(2017)]